MSNKEYYYKIEVFGDSYETGECKSKKILEVNCDCPGRFIDLLTNMLVESIIDYDTNPYKRTFPYFCSAGDLYITKKKFDETSPLIYWEMAVPFEPSRWLQDSVGIEYVDDRLKMHEATMSVDPRAKQLTLFMWIQGAALKGYRSNKQIMSMLNLSRVKVGRRYHFRYTNLPYDMKNLYWRTE